MRIKLFGFILLPVLTVASAFYLYSNKSISGDPISEEKALEGICTKPEKIDRWLLQQSWFYDSNYENIAGAFGQTSFSLYPENKKPDSKHKKELEALFCINGSELNIIYYETKFSPNSISFGNGSIVSVGFGRKLKLFSNDVVQVTGLTEKKMTLFFEGSGKQYELYRKN